MKKVTETEKDEVEFEQRLTKSILAMPESI